MDSKFYLVFIAVLFLILPAVAQNRDPGNQPQPKLISAPQPVYPKEAEESGIGGRITARISVGESGEVLSVNDATGGTELCKGGKNDPRLAALRTAVVNSLRQAKFTPGMKDGKPVRTTTTLSLTFDPTRGGGDRKIFAVERVTDKALRMPKPEYPRSARPTRAGGAVPVRVVIDESGEVFTAEAVGGHPLLSAAAVDSACKAKFSPTEMNGKTVRITGIVVYNFMPN